MKASLWVGIWQLAYKPLIALAVRQIIEGRLRNPDAPEEGRWLSPDTDDYLRSVWRRVDELVPIARLDDIPTLGSQHNVYLTIITTSAYQQLLQRGISREYAQTLVADVGWKIYAWMLKVISLPVGLTTRNTLKRMERSLRMLMVFPFSAPGAPAYEATLSVEGDTVVTNWTHCPPQTFVRQLIALQGDHGELEAFYRSWCLYDWPGADLLANDGESGHYDRRHTLSQGDAVCDMCWRAKAMTAPNETIPNKNQRVDRS